MKRITLSHISIALLAFAQGILWVNVFTLVHHGVLAYLGAIPAGVGVVITVSRAANQLPRVQSKRSRSVGWALLGLLVGVEPIVLGFANFHTVSKTIQNVWAAAVISGGASLVAVLALVLGSVVDRSLVPAEKPVKSQPKPKKPAFICSSCGYEAKTQQALNGHKRKHSKVTGYKVSFEPVKEKELK